jgi:CheY-like chemotaxis protein
VLVVDDEDLVRLVIAHKLRLSGFDTVEARDGLDALRRLEGVDVVLTDLNMPRCNGEQLCREIRTRPASATLPIVLMTGGPIDEARMHAAGCHAVLYKPLPDSLGDVLRAAIQAAAGTNRGDPPPAPPTRRSAPTTAV